MKRLLVLTILFVLTAAYADLNDGLVAYYPFSGNPDDATGNGNNGQLINGPTITQDRFGNTGSAYHFNGTNAYIQVSRLVTVGQPFTWSVWFRPDFSGTNFNAQIINQGEYPIRTSPSLGINAWPERGGAGRIGFYTYDYTWHLMFSTLHAEWDTGSWYQAIETSDIAGNRRLYVNGVLEGTASNVPFGEQNANLYIGGRLDALFAGDIDDIRIYNRSLSPSEVNQLYQYESGSPLVQFVKAFTVDYAHLSIGTNYQLQASTDLSSWTNYGAPFTATDTNYTNTSYQRISDWGKLFFRLKIAP
jgi:hypothetical protein